MDRYLTNKDKSVIIDLQTEVQIIIKQRFRTIRSRGRIIHNDGSKIVFRLYTISGITTKEIPWKKIKRIMQGDLVINKKDCYMVLENKE